MQIEPCSLKDANAFVEAYHRHSSPSRGHKFSVKLTRNGETVGVGIASRPRSRVMDDGFTLEIIRVCVVDAQHGCSMIYGALNRAAKAMGYKRVITYTMVDEPGTSVKAAGFRMDGTTSGRQWDCPSRPRLEADWIVSDRVRWIWP